MHLFCRAVEQCLLKCKTHITFDPAKPLLGLYPQGTLLQLSTRARVGVCRAALPVVPQLGRMYMHQCVGPASQRTAGQSGREWCGKPCVPHTDCGPVLGTGLPVRLHPQKCSQRKWSEGFYQTRCRVTWGLLTELQRCGCGENHLSFILCIFIPVGRTFFLPL